MKVVCFGHVCVDLITECEFYPDEDSKIGSTTSENRCLSQCWQRGGNASNSSTVLSFLGADSHFCGTMADSSEKKFLLDDFKSNDVNTELVQIISGHQCPNSCVLLSKKTGSRTIIHSNKSLPELSFQYITSLPLNTFDWLHFEGRNISNVSKVLKSLFEKSESPFFSVEVEKCRPDMDSLIPYADLVFVSKDFAKHEGAKNMEDAVTIIGLKAKNGATIVCPWGEMGAAVKCPSGDIVSSASFPPSSIVDTLGAGDSFVGSFIYSACHLKLNKRNLEPFQLVKGYEKCVKFACKMAGIKVGVKGWKLFQEEILCRKKNGTFESEL